MSEECTHDCSTCGAGCDHVDAKDLIAPLNKDSAIKHVYAIMSGKGGDLLLETCRKVLADEYKEVNEKIHLALPDEKFRRVGQSAAAASLPELRKA